MFHFPITKTNSTDSEMEFTHIDSDATQKTWNPDRIINLENIKINIFMEGDFSVFVNNTDSKPMYGDICILPPRTLHFGRIPNPTHTNYFQFDFGVNSLDYVPDGKNLIEKLILKTENNGCFFRPSKEHAQFLIENCKQLEQAISAGNMTYAYALYIECLCRISETIDDKFIVPVSVLSFTARKVISFIEENYQDKICINDIATVVGVSSSYLSRVFKRETGIGIHEYLTKYRLITSASLLKSESVSEVCYKCGFSDCSHFIHTFRSFFGCTPKEYKNRR